uniref:galactinol--sucrose galactosyltransferase n=1 Tax=Wollemia nobilis TaxID=56998 RepID=A0A0C9S393_9CONI
MTVGSAIAVNEGNLVIRGRVVFTGVPDNVVLTPLSIEGESIAAFLGAKSSESSSRHVFKLGELQGYRLMCLFRFKLWWMLPHVGNSGKDVPAESQMLLLEAREKSVLDQGNGNDASNDAFYILFLPVLEGQFRTSLQGNRSDDLEMCVESGDPAVQTSQALQAVFVTAGENPFELITESFKALEKHKGTFVHRERKKMPGILDWFGWCTWDAFYTDVNPEGIDQGLKSLVEGGTPPKFLLIDDGWQETVNEFKKEGEPFIEGTQFATRLTDIKENKKFRSKEGSDMVDGLHDVVKHFRETYDLKYVYVWHALTGYWGGLLPYAPNLKKYGATVNYPVQSPGNVANQRDIAMDSIEKYGVGIINPSKIGEFYNDLHSYLASEGIDGVKVDVQNLIETLGAGFGGRVSLTQKFQHALEDSVARNFPENACISCMSHNTDSIYNSKQTAIVRASEDFMPRNPTSQTLHIASVAFNSLFLGEVMLPDWDMFHSKHVAAEYHAAARAVGGCGVYVSDMPGDHDFKVLKKLVLPDGSVLRARFPGRPTRDCLFVDPTGDNESLLKIWNMNACTGVLGVFNCQGAGWSEEEKCIKAYENCPECVTGYVRPMDVESLGDVAQAGWSGDCALYGHNSGKLTKLSRTGSLQVSLKLIEFEVYTISPIMDYNQVCFAPLGLIDMYNGGGAIQSVESCKENHKISIKISVRGCGKFGAYASKKPTRCLVDTKEIQHSFETDKGLLTFIVPPLVGLNKISSQEIEVEF